MLCDLGRTGRWFAAEHYDVIPDLITLGKGLGGGAVALSAVGVQGNYFDTLCKGSEGFIHGGTFSHHYVAAAADNAVISIIERDNLVHQTEQLGHLIGEILKLKLADHPKVADLRRKELL